MCVLQERAAKFVPSAASRAAREQEREVLRHVHTRMHMHACIGLYVCCISTYTHARWVLEHAKLSHSAHTAASHSRVRLKEAKAGEPSHQPPPPGVMPRRRPS